MTARAARLKGDSGAVLRSRCASENEHQPEDTCEDGCEDWHFTLIEVRKPSEV